MPVLSPFLSNHHSDDALLESQGRFCCNFEPAGELCCAAILGQTMHSYTCSLLGVVSQYCPGLSILSSSLSEDAPGLFGHAPRVKIHFLILCMLARAGVPGPVAGEHEPAAL